MWDKIDSWNDGDDEEDVVFEEIAEKVAEEIALYTFSNMCHDGLGWTRDDHPRLRDANGLIDPVEEMEELEGLFDLIMNVEEYSGKLPSVLYSFHTALNKSWGKFEKGKGTVRHAILSPWYENEYCNATLVPNVLSAWEKVLEENPGIPPKPVLETLARFSPLMEEWEDQDTTLMNELENTLELLKQADQQKSSKPSIDKSKIPGVNCCYECLEDFNKQFNIEASGDLIWAKKDEGYEYDETPERLYFCEECYEDYHRY